MLPERQQAGEVVGAVQGAHPFDQPPRGNVRRGRLLVLNLGKRGQCRTVIGRVCIERHSDRARRYREAGDLVGAGLCSQRSAICTDPVCGYRHVGRRVVGLGVDRNQLCLGVAICAGQRDPVGASSVVDRERTADVAERVNRQRQRVRDTGVVGIAFVLGAQGLSCMGEEDSVPVAATALDGLDGEVLLRDGVRVVRCRRPVETIDLSPQHRTFQRTAGLALLVDAQSYR